MSSAIRLAALAAIVTACGGGAEPQPSPIAPRRAGGDSAQTALNVIVCAADDEGCVPSYAIGCPASETDSLPGPPIAPGDRAWCAGPPRGDAAAPE